MLTADYGGPHGRAHHTHDLRSLWRPDIRLLLPALGQLLSTEPKRTIRLIGAGMDEWTDDKWRDVVQTAFASADAEKAMKRVETEYHRADITAADDLKKLLTGIDTPLALYFAVPPPWRPRRVMR